MKRLIHQVRYDLRLTKAELFTILEALKSEKEVRYLHNTEEEIKEHHERLDSIIKRIREIG